MTILIVENFWERTGHTRSWFLTILEMLIRQGHSVHAVCPDGERVRESIRHWPSELQRRVIGIDEVSDLSLSRGLWHRLGLGAIERMIQWRRFWKRLRKVTRVRGVEPDLVLLPYLDPFCVSPAPIAWLMNQQAFADWFGLYFWLDESQLAPQGSLRALFWDRVSIFRGKRCRGLGVFTEAAGRALGARGIDRHWVLPDIAVATLPRETSDLADRILRSARERRIILCCGHLWPRKGVMDFVRLAATCRDRPWFFVAAGRLELDQFSQADRHILESSIEEPPENQFWHAQHIDKEENFNQLIDLASVVFAVYEDFPYSANLVTKAAAFRTPILVSDRFELGERVRRYELGRAVPEKDVSAMARAIEEILDGPPHDPNGAAEYVAAHSVERFSARLGEILATSVAS